MTVLVKAPIAVISMGTRNEAYAQLKAARDVMAYLEEKSIISSSLLSLNREGRDQVIKRYVQVYCSHLFEPLLSDVIVPAVSKILSDAGQKDVRMRFPRYVKNSRSLFVDLYAPQRLVRTYGFLGINGTDGLDLSEVNKELSRLEAVCKGVCVQHDYTITSDAVFVEDC